MKDTRQELIELIEVGYDYNALMNITGKPLSANRIWKRPEITSKVYAKFNPGVTNSNFKMSQE